MSSRRAAAASALGGLVAVTANAQSAFGADAARWAVSEFLDIVGKDGVERVVFSADAKQLRAKNVPFAVQAAASEDGNALAGLAANLLFPLGRRNGGGQGGGMGGMGGPGGPMGMLQPKSKIEMEPKTGVTFDDVAGCDASKLELE